MILAEQLQRIGAIKIDTKSPYTWTSGIKSPIYCDNRLIISFPEVRREVMKQLAGKIREDCADIDVVAGCATAGIPHAAWVAEELDLPMVYIRGSKKSHGKENRIEGLVQEGQRAVVIEDLISTGGSAITASASLEAMGVNVVKVLSIFTYGLAEAEKAFRQVDLPYESLLDYSELIETLDVTEEEKEVLGRWRHEMDGK